MIKLLSNKYLTISSELLFLLIIIFLTSCSKKDEIENHQESFIIKLNDSGNILSVIHTNDQNITSNFSYDYLDKSIKQYSDNGTLAITYYLNEAGLADSASNGLKFIYDSNGYFICDDSNNSLKEIHTYSNDNRIMTKIGSNKIYYEYNTLKNVIDILYFKGPFLGRLNKNLISKEILEFTKASNRVETYFQYVINQEGLVTERTSISKYFNGSPDKKSVTTFVYKY